MSFGFKSHDFIFTDDEDMARRCARKANQLLDEHILSLPKMVAKGHAPNELPALWHHIGDECSPAHPTHRARLWGVEEIKKESQKTKSQRAAEYLRQLMDEADEEYDSRVYEALKAVDPEAFAHKQKKCEHLTARGIQVKIAGPNELGGFETTCSLCGKRLIAEWRSVEE